MKTAIVLFAGVMTASAALAAMNDRMAEERYRAKYGRNTPAEEARKRSDIKDTDKNPIQDCCRAMHGAAASSTIMFNGSAHEARFRAKYGSGTAREELRQKAEMKDLALHVRKCADLGQCPRVHVELLWRRPGPECLLRVTRNYVFEQSSQEALRPRQSRL